MGLINYEVLKTATPTEGDDVRKALVCLLKTLGPIYDHAKWSMDYCRRSPSSHQEFIREDTEKMQAFTDAVQNAMETLFPPTDPPTQPTRNQAEEG